MFAILLRSCGLQYTFAEFSIRFEGHGFKSRNENAEKILYSPKEIIAQHNMGA